MPATEREILRARAEAVFGRPSTTPIVLGPVSRRNPKTPWGDTGPIPAPQGHVVRVERRHRKRATVH